MGTPSISGRLYDVDFNGPTHMVSISYEPGDEQFLITVAPVGQSRLSDYDNRTITPRLGDLNERYMKFVAEEERLANEAAFSSIAVKSKEELHLLKSAIDLSLVLHRYLEDR